MKRRNGRQDTPNVGKPHCDLGGSQSDVASHCSMVPMGVVPDHKFRGKARLVGGGYKLEKRVKAPKKKGGKVKRWLNTSPTPQMRVKTGGTEFSTGNWLKRGKDEIIVGNRSLHRGRF